MDIKSWKIMLAVDDYGSFTRVGAELGYTQSGITQMMKNLEKKPNYMTVPAAVGELEKIEMTRQTDNVYRLDHAVTAKQKKILKAFGMNEGNITYRAGEISNTLKKSNIQKERR